MCIALFSSLSSSAQNFAKLLKQPIANFVYTDAVVMEKFRPSGAYPFEGTVVFQPVQWGGVNEMQMHLIREDGVKFFSRRLEISASNGFTSTDFIPIAASYNEVEDLYCVTGVVQSGTAWNDYTTWVGILDEDLNPILWQILEIQTTTFSLTQPNSTFVTDVCPVYDGQGFCFAFTGLLLESGQNASPIYKNFTPPDDKRIFITALTSGTYFFTPIGEYSFAVGLGTAVDKEYFPSRIIEIPNTGGNGGYLVAGNVKFEPAPNANQLAAFYLRTDYQLNILDAQSRKLNTNGLIGSLFIGDIKYDPVPDEVYVAGSIHRLEDAVHSFFADKLENVVNTTSINLFSDTWNGTPQLGALEVPVNPLFGWTKVGRIDEVNDGYNVITSAIYENGNYTNTQKLPTLFEIRYDDNSLNNWTSGGQNPSIHYYPRLYGTNAPVQYFSGIDYTSQWYPNHSSHPLDAVAGEYILGGFGIYPSGSGVDHLAVLKTDNTYDNDCSHFNIDCNQVFFPTEDNLLQASVIPGASIFQFQIIVVDNSTVTVDEYDCLNHSFKGIVPEMKLVNQSGIIQVKNMNNTMHYELISSQGARIKEGDLYPEEKINLSELPRGIYFIKFDKQVFKVQN
jgi:hypothetical protein